MQNFDEKEFKRYDQLKANSVIMVPGSMGAEVILADKPLINTAKRTLTVKVKNVICKDGSRSIDYINNNNKEWELNLDFKGQEWTHCGAGQETIWNSFLLYDDY